MAQGTNRQGAAVTTSPAWFDSSVSVGPNGYVVAPEYTATGLPGATAPSRYAGATTSGAPSAGTFAAGDFVIDQTGTVWVCVTAGSPGSWKSPGPSSGAPLALASGGTGVSAASDAALLAALGAAPVNDPLQLGYCTCLVSEALVAGTLSIVVASYTQFYRIVAGGYTISSLNVFPTVQSGNVQLAYYSNSSGVPGTQLAASALTSVGTANAPQALSLGGPYTPRLGEFLAIYCDNTTAKFAGYTTTPILYSASMGAQNRYFASTQMPSPASATLGGYEQIHIWGS